MNKLKYLLVLLVHAFGGCAVSGQLGVKTYAFEQVSLPGTITSGVTDEAGNPLNTSKAGHPTKYYIYLGHAPGSTIMPSALWIKGQPYTFTTEAIAKTPVVHATPNEPQEVRKDVLVPQTKDTVMRLLVSAPVNAPAALSAEEKKMVLDSAVLVRYSWKGKVYYAGAPAVKTLPPLRHQ